MSEIARLIDQLDRSWSGEAWHGPALAEILEDVDAAVAAARPLPTAHTIWELVGHLAAWQRVAASRLSGENATPSKADEFPSPASPSEAAWRAELAELASARVRLRECVAALTDDELDLVPEASGHTAYRLIHGVIQHDLYHGGQIAILAGAARG